MVAGDLLKVMVENFPVERRQFSGALQLQLQAFGKVAAADAGRIETLHEFQCGFGVDQLGVFTHRQVGGSAAEITGVVDRADDLLRQPPDFGRRITGRQFRKQLFLQRRGVGERVEHEVVFFVGEAGFPGAGRHRQFVGPLLVFHGALVERAFIFLFGSFRLRGKFHGFGLHFGFQQRIGGQLLGEPFFEFEGGQIQKLQRLKLAGGKLLFLAKCGG